MVTPSRARRCATTAARPASSQDRAPRSVSPPCTSFWWRVAGVSGSAAGRASRSDSGNACRRLDVETVLAEAAQLHVRARIGEHVGMAAGGLQQRRPYLPQVAVVVDAEGQM